MMVGRTSETPWVDFMARVKFGLIASVAIFLLILGHVYWAQWTDSRSYRNLMGQTAFADVEFRTSRIGPNTMTVEGTFRKVRDCLLFGYPTIMVELDGYGHPALISNINFDPRTYRRPVSEIPQRFGPWTIESSVADPEELVVYMTHVCGNEYQTNEFLRTPWE
jgi:hypothetical protein